MTVRTLVAAFLAVLVLAIAPPATAEERDCTGTIGGETVDNLRVPDGATCRLEGTFVKGTVKVESGATLIAKGIHVIGNVQAENANSVTVRRSSRVDGSIQIKQGGAARVRKTVVGSDILFDENARRWWRPAIASRAISRPSRTPAG